MKDADNLDEAHRSALNLLREAEASISNGAATRADIARVYTALGATHETMMALTDMLIGQGSLDKFEAKLYENSVIISEGARRLYGGEDANDEQ